jgi:hypothetical protein
MRHPRTSRLNAAAVVGLIAAAGCTHNYYYGNAIPVCEAPAAASAPVVAYGDVCEVPPRTVGLAPPARVASGGAAAAAPIITRRPPARVVISEPIATPRTAPGTSRLGWRNRRDEDFATTRISGATDETQIR